MLREEFEKLTGLYPSLSLYKEIERAYMESESDKYAFCKAYGENRDGLAEKIQMSADLASAAGCSAHEEAVKELGAKIEALEKALEKEQEWRDSDINVKSLAAYSRLKNCTFAKALSEQEALGLVCNEWGFDRNKVKIITQIHLYEVSRHRQVRPRKEVPVPPLYASTDWNYVRFACGPVTYEMIDGELTMI